MLWLIFGGVRFAGFSLQNERHQVGFSFLNYCNDARSNKH
jgi:hypothetical protein